MQDLHAHVEELFSDHRFDGRFYGFQMVDQFLRLCGRDPHKAADRWLAGHEPKIDQVERNRERNRESNMTPEQIKRKRERDRGRFRVANMTPAQIEWNRARKRVAKKKKAA